MNSNIIYKLYLKTHNVTGLKYLGTTKKENPYTYKGSGEDWLPHLKEHGYDVTTEILFETTNKDELKTKGLYYSELWDIVESEEFANRIPESAGGGGSNAFRKGTKMITNGVNIKYISKEEIIPEGWTPGLPNNSAKVFSTSTNNKITITDENIVRYISKDESIPKGWRRGRPKKISITNGKNNKYISPSDKIPEGWYKGNMSAKGKICINNGKIFKRIPKDEAIPKGWKRGALPKK
jgi:hypothetical protein